MTREEYRTALDDMIYLVSCAVNETVPDQSRVESANLPNLHTTADHHLLTAAVAYALESAEIHDPSFTQAKARAIRKAALMDAEKAEISAKMEEAGIWYMPLKGAVLKDYYPRFGMREMADCDILFDASRADDVKTIMVERGYDVKRYGKGIHDCYHKEPVYNFEMHRSLFGARQDPVFQEYYSNMESRLIGDGYERHFTPEDFYVYMIAHEYKHYSVGGTGLRSVLDTYVFLNEVSLDMGYVEAEVKKLGIGDFEKENRSLALHLFGGGNLMPEDREMLKYIFSSGTYGTVVHKVENKMKKNGWNKVQYVLHRLFVPVSKKNKEYDFYARAFPLFYKYKVLLPVLLIYRPIRGIWNGRLRSEVNAIRKIKR